MGQRDRTFLSTSCGLLLNDENAFQTRRAASVDFEEFRGILFVQRCDALLQLQTLEYFPFFRFADELDSLIFQTQM